MADGGGEVNRYLTEPMLVRDATRTAVPGGLACLCAHTPLASTQDALCAVLHVLMLESAFRAQVSFERAKEIQTSSNAGLRITNCMRNDRSSSEKV